MVIMNVHLDNFLLFRDFDLDLSYSKKPVHTIIENEHLTGRNNFRYKKAVVLMGANATGKTALGKVLCGIVNFIAKKEAGFIFPLIEDTHLPASFSIDLAFPNHILYRVSAHIRAKKNLNDDYSGEDISVSVRHTEIKEKDSYEKCAARLSSTSELSEGLFYSQVLESVPHLSWLFVNTYASDGRQIAVDPADPLVYSEILSKVLKTLDPRILKVEKIDKQINPRGVNYAIVYPNNIVYIEDGRINFPDRLSSGTLDGIDIAQLITGMKLNAHAFYYCDEKFSHMHSDVEKAFLSLMISLLGENQQFFFTTHNLDILEMNLPRHSFCFLRRDEFSDHQISCVFASDYIKKNNISLRNAVENDLFSTVPSTADIYRIEDLDQKGLHA